MTKLTKKQKELAKKMKKTYKKLNEVGDKLFDLFYLAEKEKMSPTYLARELMIDKSAVYRRMKRSATKKHKLTQ